MKSKEQKRREAKERKQRNLPKWERYLKESMIFLETLPDSEIGKKRFQHSIHQLNKMRKEAGLEEMTLQERRRIPGWNDAIHGVSMV